MNAVIMFKFLQIFFHTFSVLFLWIWDYNMFENGVVCCINLHKNKFERKVSSSIKINSNYYQSLELTSPAFQVLI